MTIIVVLLEEIVKIYRDDIWKVYKVLKKRFLVIIRHSSHLIIWDLVGHLRSPNMLVSMLSKNMEDGLEWPLALAYILYLY